MKNFLLKTYSLPLSFLGLVCTLLVFVNIETKSIIKVQSTPPPLQQTIKENNSIRKNDIINDSTAGIRSVMCELMRLRNSPKDALKKRLPKGLIIGK